MSLSSEKFFLNSGRLNVLCFHMFEENENVQIRVCHVDLPSVSAITRVDCSKDDRDSERARYTSLTLLTQLAALSPSLTVTLVPTDF